MLLAMMLAAFVWNIVQVGILIAPEVLQPQFARLNPLAGFRRILSPAALMRLAVSLAKLAIAVGIAAWSIGSMLPWFIHLIDLEPRVTLFYVEGAVVKLAFQLSSALVFLALLDFLYQRWKLEQDLRMSKQEVRDEMKEMEGDPVMRQRRREAHRKVAQARELRQVRTADVVITNPTEIAVALKYDPEKMPAPVVVAKGMGVIAASIRRIAAENRIPDHRAERGGPVALPHGEGRPSDPRRDVPGLRRDHGLRLPRHGPHAAEPRLNRAAAPAAPVHTMASARPALQRDVSIAITERIGRSDKTRDVAQPGLARLLGVQEVAGSNPVVPTVRDRKPFGENIERFSHCGD